MTQQAMLFDLCMKDAKKLVTKNFMPEIDNLEEQNISSILFKVLIEHDLLEEGEITAPKAARVAWQKKVNVFIGTWKAQLPTEEQGMYRRFA